MNDFIKDTIERSKWNIVEIKGTVHTYKSRFAPHLKLSWGKTIIENFRKVHRIKSL